MSRPTDIYAFPCTTGSDGGIFQQGMTLRDYFAAKALNGMLATPEAGASNQTLARYAYEVADAMLAEREKSN